MNVEEPDKFEQFMSWTRETGESIGVSLDWLARHAEGIAIASAAPIVILTILVVARARKRNPEVSGMRHAGR